MSFSVPSLSSRCCELIIGNFEALQPRYDLEQTPREDGTSEKHRESTVAFIANAAVTIAFISFPYHRNPGRRILSVYPLSALIVPLFSRLSRLRPPPTASPVLKGNSPLENDHLRYLGGVSTSKSVSLTPRRHKRVHKKGTKLQKKDAFSGRSNSECKFLKRWQS